jgi:cytochrome c
VDGFEWNKIAGWLLACGLFIMGIMTLTDGIFHVPALEAKAYPIEGVEEAGAEGAAAVIEGPALAELLAVATAEKGASLYKRCATCHTINQGGANGTGPNLYGILGAKHAHIASFNYSDAMKAKAAEPWTWEAMDAWIKNPKAAIPKNKMSFAGISKAEDRAALLIYLNQNSANPLPLPAVPVKTEVAAAPAAEGAAAEAAPVADALAPAEAAPAAAQ